MVELLVLLGLILVGFGSAMMFFPQIAWRSAEGWRFANAEPSGAALLLYRAFGLIGAAGGTALIWYAWRQV